MNISELSRKDLKRLSKVVAQDCKKFGEEFTELPPNEWGEMARAMARQPVAIFRSNRYLCQVYDVIGGYTRLSICRTAIDVDAARWKDGLSWEELQGIKKGVGFGDRDAVEVYPRDEDIVNVANMRHLWILPEGSALPFAWRKLK